jgi:AcrR family transcriptional regulator
MSPRTKQQYEGIRQRSISAIQEAALELFARNGYHNTSISQIAKEAGVSKGLLYNYFSSKEVLLKEIVMGAVEVGEQFMEQLANPTEEPVAQLRWLTEVTFATVQENRRYWKLMTALALQADALSGLMPVIKEKQEESIRSIASLFEAMGAENPREMAYYYGAVLDGVLLHYMQMVADYPISAMKAMVLQQFTPDTR